MFSSGFECKEGRNLCKKEISFLKIFKPTKKATKYHNLT